MPALSAILIARNEESDLPRALQSLAGVADEIILVDAASTDHTVEIARAAGAKVF
jgi:glycosyltransferase involved in cell wall biosynthesis